MKYINKQEKQLIIDTKIHKSITKTITKDGIEKENIKYVAHIPNEILIYLLEKYQAFNVPGADSDAENIDAILSSDVDYIDTMLSSDEQYYLSFYDHPADSDDVQLQITNNKIPADDGASVTIKKQVTSNSYFFTVSKKVFKELKNNNNSIGIFRYVLDFDCDSDLFKNSVVCVKLV